MSDQERTVRFGSDEFAALIRDGVAESKRVAAIMPQPMASIYISKAGNAVDVCLDCSKSTYSEWIKGEGGDIGLSRDQETKRVAGAHLPLYAKSILIGGEVLPEMAFDLETGKAIDISKSSPTPAVALDKLDSSSPVGWYECECVDTPGQPIVFWWTGHMLIKRRDYRDQMHLASYRNFRRLVPAGQLDTSLTEAIREKIGEWNPYAVVRDHEETDRNGWVIGREVDDGWLYWNLGGLWDRSGFVFTGKASAELRCENINLKARIAELEQLLSQAGRSGEEGESRG